MAAAMIRPAFFVLLTGVAPASAQDFAFRQDCALTLFACDMARDGDPNLCPAGQAVNARFFAEGENFHLSADGLGDYPIGGKPPIFSLGQGYVTDDLRVFYVQYHPTVDGLFWIGSDGRAGAHLNRNGLEDYFEGSCTPLPE
jgi:hypothetical protein